MGEGTAIAYAHDTFNGWIGCTEVDGNPQCGGCYAREMAKFRGWAQWGDEHPRMLTSHENWKKPFRWNREAEASGEQRRVFAFSLGDVFDEFAPLWPQDRPWPGKKYAPSFVPALDVFMHQVVEKTPHLTWMLFTKRYERASQYLSHIWKDSPWPNVWVIFSAGTQRNLESAIYRHREFSAVVHGISCEPSFEQLDFGNMRELQWVIGGTESGRNARHTDKLDWFRNTADQCERRGVPFYMKQITDTNGRQIPYEQWPADLRVREFPRAEGER